MIHIHLRPVAGHVTVIADIATRDMRSRFSRCRRSVMTRIAGPPDRRVVYRRIQPGRGRMAIITRIQAGNVRRSLPGSCRSVVARVAGAGYPRVIHRGV